MDHPIAYLIGLGGALAISLFARVTGLDRDRAFYPTVIIVVAFIYGLFAVMGGSPAELTGEWVAMGGFILLLVLGFRLNLWFGVVALFAHGVFDFSRPPRLQSGRACVVARVLHDL